MTPVTPKEKNTGHAHHDHHAHPEMRLQLLLTIVILILVIGNYVATYYTFMHIEYGKVGGKENYEILSSLQKKQVATVVDYYKTNPSALTQPEQVAPAADTKTAETMRTSINGTTLLALKEGYGMVGKNDALLSWIEYSDLECPYCKQLQENKAQENLAKKYDGQINYMFKHFPLNIHPGSQKKHELLECMRELHGDDAYYTLKDDIFAANGYNAPISFDNALEIAASDNGDSDALQACIDEGRYSDKVRASITEGQNYFEVSGTPATVILNNTTGEYRFVSGVASEAQFESIIISLLGQ